MKAIAVFPGEPGSIHLADLPEPSVDDVPDVLRARRAGHGPGGGTVPGLAGEVADPSREGLGNHEEMIRLLTEEKNVVKVFVEVNGRL